MKKINKNEKRLVEYGGIIQVCAVVIGRVEDIAWWRRMIAYQQAMALGSILSTKKKGRKNLQLLLVSN